MLKCFLRDTSPHASVLPQPKPTPISRPMSPTEQLDIMNRQEEEMRATQKEPTEKDLEASNNTFNTEPVSCE